ncbi:hypothetical protein [Vibrio europaeus]|uniref:hypothetical protein n=1 Tax=Vibrio europaeus TaxID=300876 RepID=UPI00233EFE24|nr:hypothetical protein [Vibrio europaeus]MDC5853481.1 hypothetical protein [Vibrio europaeus]
MNLTYPLSSYDLLTKVINPIREMYGENPLRNNDFNEKVCNELGLSYETFVEALSTNNRKIKVIDLDADQCLLVGMRESKGVRQSVLKQLRAYENAQTLDEVRELQKVDVLTQQKADRLDTFLSKRNSLPFEDAALLAGIKHPRLARSLLVERGKLLTDSFGSVMPTSIGKMKGFNMRNFGAQYGESLRLDSNAFQLLERNADSINRAIERRYH